MIYISGCGGMLGEAFYRLWSKEEELTCSDIDVNEPWLQYCDVRDEYGYLKSVEKSRADVLIHLAALTDLEYCEANPRDAYMTNTIGVENAAYIANTLTIPLIYVSTAGIFDGKKEIYDDWDLPNPIGVYARSKYVGEVFVREHVRRHLVCRAGWMMGGGKKDKKFVKKIIDKIPVEGTADLFVVMDKQGTPTYTDDFALTVRQLLASQNWGTYNVVCHGLTTRFEVARAIVDNLNRSNLVKVHGVTSDFWRGTYWAPRPPSEQLLCRKLELRGNRVMRPWTVALSSYIQQFWSDKIL